MRYNRPSEDAVKSSTKGFLIGFVSGITLMVILVVGAYVALMLSVQAMMEQGAGAAMIMPAPHMPAVDRLTVYGQADYAWKLSTLDGEAVTLESYRGKTVLLNHWATWCGPCVAEMPSLAALHESIDRDDVAIVLVSMEDAGTVRSFFDEKGFSLPAYVAADLPAVFESRGIPATFIFDSEGTVVFSHIGAANWDSDDCRDFLSAIADS